MYGDENSGHCEEIVGEVEGEPSQWCPGPALTELEERELREEYHRPSSPANCEREEGARLAVLVLARAEMEPGEEVSEGPEPVPEEDCGDLQHPAHQAVPHPPGVGLAGLGAEVSLG